MKKFLEFDQPEEIIPEPTESVLNPQLAESIAGKTSTQFLQSFSKTYSEFNENVKKAEQLLLQLESVESHLVEKDEEILKRDELESILTTHLLIVNENIQHIKADLSEVNKNNLTNVTSIIDEVNSKTETILEYIGAELPKNKNKLYELDLTVNKKIDLLNLDVVELTQSTSGVYEQLNQFEESINEKLSELDSNLNLSETVQQEVIKQITDLHEELKQANTSLTEITVAYNEVLSPALVELDEVKETLKSSDATIQEYYSNLDKTKAELKQVINEVNTIFINEKYVELDRKVDKIEEIFNRLAGRQIIVEEVKSEEIEVKQAGEMYSKAELDRIFTNKTFQQPNPEPVSPDFAAVTAKLKFLEQAIGRIAAAGPGGGEVNLRWLDDVDRSTIADGKYLRYSDTTKKFEFATVTGGGGAGTINGTENQITSTTLGDVVTLSLPNAITAPGDLTITGNLTVNGTTTTINTSTLTVDDINIELGSTASPTDITANNGGITLKGTSDKTFRWISSTSAWTSSEHLAVDAGKTLRVSGSASGTTVIQANATASGTLTLPTTTGTLATLNGNETFTNKTLTSPTLTGTTAFAAGTALLPSISTTGDTNTGIFFPAADTIAFSEGGVESMRIDSSGNVGIKTTATSSALLTLNANLDPGTYTKGIIHAASTGVGGGTAAPQYGLFFDIRSYNNATTMTGVYSKAQQNTGGVSHGVWGESGGSATNLTYGVYGRSLQGDTNGSGIAYGVYGVGNSTIGATNTGYSVGVASETNNYVKNINFLATSSYTGALSQTVLSVVRNSLAIGSITTSTAATSYNTSSTSGVIGIDANTIAFNTASTERMRINSTGNVGIGTTTPGYKLEVNGAFAATSKSFLIPHPTKEGKKLRYGSLEGPENGVYIRGKLKDNNTIELPEYWTKLVDPDSITVNLTPIGKYQSLYVESIENNKVVIGNGNLINKNINCFFVVYAERVDIDKLVVEL